MDEEMKMEAVYILRKAIEDNAEHPCVKVRDSFTEIYENYTWNCVEYYSYGVSSHKSIDIEMNDSRYLLFGIEN